LKKQPKIKRGGGVREEKTETKRLKIPKMGSLVVHDSVIKKKASFKKKETGG